MSEKITAIGHITKDKAYPEDVIGGGVSYSMEAINRFGLKGAIITKIPEGHRFIQDLQAHGISVITLPTNSDEITTFRNDYDDNKNRTQTVSARQESITLTDISSLSNEQLDSSWILVAPVISEVETNVIPKLAEHGLVAVTPQGYFRETGDNGVIFQKEWSGFEHDLSFAAVTILSNDDIAIGGILNEGLLNRLATSSRSLILTKGEKGSDFYENGEKVFSVSAFHLDPSEIKDLTGAGDTFAAAYLAKYLKTKSAYESAVFASLVAAIKIMAISGRGIDSIPTKEQIEEFVLANQNRVKEFLVQNQIENLDLTI